MADAHQEDPKTPHRHALDRPFALAVFVITSLGVAPYNWFFVVGSAPVWLVSLTSVVFLYGAALTSIPAGAALKRYVDTKVQTPRKAVLIYTILLVIFIAESIALPSIRVAWDKSTWLSMVSGATVIVQLLVTSYLQKIVWDRAVKLTDEQAI